ncbi:MAG: glycosyltransferase family 4 protein [Patescibacteria group bacterium]|nr:glycosyltransferase family 4 protein [Patescibacteria group bacterium]
MFGWEFPPYNSGGLGVACYGLSKALAERGVELSFVLPKKIDVNPGFLKLIFASPIEIKLRFFDSLLTPYVSSREYNERRTASGGGLYGSSLFDEVRRYASFAGDIARTEEFDVIHAHDWLSFPAGIEAKKATGKPLVVHVHATEYDRTGNGSINQHVYEIEKEGMTKADKVIAVSGFTKNKIIDGYGIPSSKIEVVHNGDDPSSASGESGEEGLLPRIKEAGYKLVLFVGRFTLQKGPDYFLRAAKRVLEIEPKTFFAMVGSGDMDSQLRKESAELGVSGRVIFTGFLRGGKLADAFRAADVLVMPSVSEPFGIVPLESLRNGTPVIISKQSGVSEILNQALKVDFWDVEEMANKIVSVMRHPSLANQLARGGKEEANAATWPKAALKCINIYKSVLARS